MQSQQQSLTLKRSLIGTAIVATLFGAYALYGKPAINEAHAILPAAAAPVEAVRTAPTALPDFASIVSQQGPAVVNISVTGTVKTAIPGFPQMDPNDPFYEFFRRFRIPQPHGEAPAQGMGSGFILSADGVILTNAHVVAEAKEVTVKLTDKREFKAKVVGLDRLTDVAVLRIDAKKLPTVRVGNPDQTRVGDWVLAIGSPFGFENSVTAGIVSAKSRSLPDEGYVPFLQTDVAINPGNSGGPLFNLNGEVIGINSQIYSRSGGYQGLSFAIPIDMAMKIERQLVDRGKVSRGRLGVTIQEINQQLADSFGLPKPTGALVSAVEKDSPAAKAGVEAGDVILKFNGKEINRSSDLPPLVADVVPGTPAKLEIWRKGGSKEVSIKVGEMPTNLAQAEDNTDDKSSLGVAVRPLNPEERKRAEVASGLLVQDVADGPAARAGIRPGDIILAVNGEKITQPEDLRKLLAKSGKRIALLIKRGDHSLYVPLNLG